MINNKKLLLYHSFFRTGNYCCIMTLAAVTKMITGVENKTRCNGIKGMTTKWQLLALSKEKIVWSLYQPATDIHPSRCYFFRGQSIAWMIISNGVHWLSCLKTPYAQRQLMGDRFGFFNSKWDKMWKGNMIHKLHDVGMRSFVNPPCLLETWLFVGKTFWKNKVYRKWINLRKHTYTCV